MPVHERQVTALIQVRGDSAGRGIRFSCIDVTP